MNTSNIKEPFIFVKTTGGNYYLTK